MKSVSEEPRLIESEDGKFTKRAKTLYDNILCRKVLVSKTHEVNFWNPVIGRWIGNVSFPQQFNPFLASDLSPRICQVGRSTLALGDKGGNIFLLDLLSSKDEGGRKGRKSKRRMRFSNDSNSSEIQCLSSSYEVSPKLRPVLLLSGDKTSSTVCLWKCSDKNKRDRLSILRRYLINVHDLMFVDKMCDEFVAICDDSVIRTYSSETGSVLKTINSHSGSVRCVDVFRNENIVLSGSWDKTIRITSLDKSTKRKRDNIGVIETEDRIVSLTVLDQRSSQFVGTDWQGVLKCWDLRKLRDPVWTNEHAHPSNTFCNGVVSDRNLVVSSSNDGLIRIFDSQSNGKLVRMLKERDSVSGLSFFLVLPRTRSSGIFGYPDIQSLPIREVAKNVFQTIELPNEEKIKNLWEIWEGFKARPTSLIDSHFSKLIKTTEKLLKVKTVHQTLRKDWECIHPSLSDFNHVVHTLLPRLVTLVFRKICLSNKQFEMDFMTLESIQVGEIQQKVEGLHLRNLKLFEDYREEWEFIESRFSISKMFVVEELVQRIQIHRNHPKRPVYIQEWDRASSTSSSSPSSSFERRSNNSPPNYNHARHLTSSYSSYNTRTRNTTPSSAFSFSNINRTPPTKMRAKSSGLFNIFNSSPNFNQRGFGSSIVEETLNRNSSSSSHLSKSKPEQMKDLIYFGQIRNGVCHGRGVLYTKMSDSHLQQFGTSYAQIFRGRFSKGMKEGKGRTYDPSSGLMIYEGVFSCNRKHGMGSFYDEKSRQVIEGVWEHGRLVSQEKQYSFHVVQIADLKKYFRYENAVGKGANGIIYKVPSSAIYLGVDGKIKKRKKKKRQRKMSNSRKRSWSLRDTIFGNNNNNNDNDMLEEEENRQKQQQQQQQQLKERDEVLVAVKILNLDVRLSTIEGIRARRAITHSLKNCAQLLHPNICRILGMVQGEGKMGYIMDLAKASVDTLFAEKIYEYVNVSRDEGVKEKEEDDEEEDMKKKKKKKLEISVQSKLTMSRKLSILLQTAQGMGYIHGRNMMHRDLKWSNVLIDFDGNVKITDFDTAKADHSSWKFSVNHTKTSVGTPTYVAPEVYSGSYSTKVDVFSYGVMIYAMLFEMNNPYSRTHECPCGMVIRNISCHTFPEHVAKCGLRPTIHPDQIDQLGKKYYFLINLMRYCWQGRPSQRPDFSKIVEILESEIQKTKRSYSRVIAVFVRDGGDNDDDDDVGTVLSREELLLLTPTLNGLLSAVRSIWETSPNLRMKKTNPSRSMSIGEDGNNNNNFQRRKNHMDLITSLRSGDVVSSVGSVRSGSSMDIYHSSDEEEEVGVDNMNDLDTKIRRRKKRREKRRRRRKRNKRRRRKEEEKKPEEQKILRIDRIKYQNNTLLTDEDVQKMIDSNDQVGLPEINVLITSGTTKRNNIFEDDDEEEEEEEVLEKEKEEEQEKEIERKSKEKDVEEIIENLYDMMEEKEKKMKEMETRMKEKEEEIEMYKSMLREKNSRIKGLEDEVQQFSKKGGIE